MQVFLDPRVPATRWADVFDAYSVFPSMRQELGVPGYLGEIPERMCDDARFPASLAVVLLERDPFLLGRHVDTLTRRADVRPYLSYRTWRRLLRVGTAPVVLRAIDELGAFSVTDLMTVLQRRERDWIVSGLLMTQWDTLSDEHWGLLVDDWQSAWAVVRDDRLGEEIIEHYLKSSHPSVLSSIAQQPRFSDELRIQAGLLISNEDTGLVHKVR